MKISRRQLLATTGSAAAMMALGGRAMAQEPLGDPSWNYDLVIGGGSATGNSRILASAIGKIITDNVQGVRASGAVVPGYDAESAMHVHNGTMIGGVGTPLIIENATKGVEPFPSEGIDLRLWFYHNELPLNILGRSDTGFTQISELKGATVALAPRGTSNYLFSEIVFEANGVPLSDVNVRFMDTSKALEQLQNGNIDAMSYVRDFSGAVLELTGSRDVTLLQPSEESIPVIQERINWAGPVDWPFVEQYPNMTVPEPGLAFVSPEFMFLKADLPDDLVYAMTRAVWENVGEIQRSTNVYSDVNLQEALKRVPITPHPGALRYYEEQDVPGWDEFQDQLSGG